MTDKRAIVFLGCSWVAGWNFPWLLKKYGTLDFDEKYGLHSVGAIGDENINVPENNRRGHPSMLLHRNRDKLAGKVDIYNLGMSASDNMSMYHRLAMELPNLLSQYKRGNVLVVHSTTAPDRFSFLRWNESSQGVYIDLHNTYPQPEKLAGQSKYENMLCDSYAKLHFSRDSALHLSTLAMLNIQTMCSAYEFKYVMGNSFYPNFEEYKTETIFGPSVNWDINIHNIRNYDSFANLLLQEDDNIPDRINISDVFKYSYVGTELKYMSDCFHPNLEGHWLISNHWEQYILVHHPEFLNE